MADIKLEIETLFQRLANLRKQFDNNVQSIVLKQIAEVAHDLTTLTHRNKESNKKFELPCTTPKLSCQFIKLCLECINDQLTGLAKQNDADLSYLYYELQYIAYDINYLITNIDLNSSVNK